MAQRKAHVFFTSATSASVSGSYQTDYRFDDGGTQRVLTGILTSGAEVNVYVITSAENHVGTNIQFAHLETTISVGSSSYSSDTNTFAEVLNGPIQRVKVVKAGSSGTATVLGIM